MQSPDDYRPPKWLAGSRYEIKDRLGRGGMAEVWSAWDHELGVMRAVKILIGHGAALAARARRLRTEARAMAQAGSPRVLRVYDIVVEQGVPFIVMDLAPGGSLDDRLRANGPLSPRAAVRLMVDVLAALQSAHEIGVIHRDVKPSNILLDAEGRALLADFGIALIEGDAARYTRTGITMGSMAFMAPEQRLDARTVGPTADVYASGATLYHLVTGSTAVDLFLAETSSPRWVGVPPTLRQVIQRATRVTPSDRFASAGQLRDALLAIVDELPDEPTVTQVPDPGGDTVGDDVAEAPRSVSRPPPSLVVDWWRALFLLAALAGLVGVGFAMLFDAAGHGKGAAEGIPAEPPPTAAAPTALGVLEDMPSAGDGGNEAAPPAAPPVVVAVERPRPVVSPAVLGRELDAASKASNDAPPPVVGDWMGMFDEKQVRITLRGRAEALSGTVEVGYVGGQVQATEVRGRYLQDRRRLELDDLDDVPSAGRYSLDLSGDGRTLRGSFASRRARPDGSLTVSVSVSRVGEGAEP